MIERIAQDIEPNAKILGKISGEAFLTPPGALSELVAEAIHAETDVRPEMSTTGGTSDARFLHELCTVGEFGLTNATMHKPYARRGDHTGLDNSAAFAQQLRALPHHTDA